MNFFKKQLLHLSICCICVDKRNNAFLLSGSTVRTTTSLSPKLQTLCIGLRSIKRDQMVLAKSCHQLQLVISCRTSWVKLNRLRTGVGRFHSSMYKWGAAPSPNCECGASEQTADHIISTCPLHRAPKGIQGLLVLDDDTRRWLKINAVNI